MRRALERLLPGTGPTGASATCPCGCVAEAVWRRRLQRREDERRARSTGRDQAWRRRTDRQLEAAHERARLAEQDLRAERHAVVRALDVAPARLA